MPIQNPSMSDPPRKTLTATPAMKEAVADRPELKPRQKRKPLLTRDTRVGEAYWCDFSPMNWTPEFDYQHLVVIVRGGKISGDIHAVIPLTKVDQSGNPHGYRLLHNPNPGSAEVSWAVCNHIYSVASERLKPLRDAGGNRKTPEKLHDEDLREISLRLRNALKTFLTLGLPAPAADPTPPNQGGAPEGEDGKPVEPVD